jgi:selenocysteine lyase/cysteine desulfurase
VIDLETEQTLTPGCRDQIFLDSAGSSLPPSTVVDEVVMHLHREAAVGGYRAANERIQDLTALPDSVARLIGASADEIALSDSATRSWNQFVTALPWRSRDRILICGNEYASNAIALLQRAREYGCTVEVVPDGPDGDIDLGALSEMLDERVRLVSVVHVATNSGRITLVPPIVELAHAVGALVVLDACQSVGQLAIDVAELGVDALSATGRKWLRAPRGTGFLYLRRDLLEQLEPPAADLHGGTWDSPDRYTLRPDAGRFELWESDVAGRLGLKVAIDHLLGLGAAEVESAVRSRSAQLRAGLGALDGVTVQDRGSDFGGLVTFTVTGLDADEVRDSLLTDGVTVSVSSAGSTRIDMASRGLSAVVRASPHYFVGPDQIEEAVAAVARIAMPR